MPKVPRKFNVTYETALPNRDRRFRELIVYISDRCADDPTYGATKLNKILWGADFISFLHRGKPITGERYQRLENGPAPVRLKPVRTEMEGKDIVVRPTNYYGKLQHRIVPLRDADLSIFSGEEIALVDRAIEFFRNRTARETSDLSHGKAWKTRYDGDLIPYEAAFLSNEPITAADVSRTEELGRKLNWHAYQKTAGA
jgi:hypothetical protein